MKIEIRGPFPIHTAHFLGPSNMHCINIWPFEKVTKVFIVIRVPRDSPRTLHTLWP